MFGFTRKSTSSAEAEEDRLAEWQRSPSVPVTKATGLKTRVLLGNLGRELRAVYRNESCVIRPLSVFRKPAYNRMYVEAICDGETKILNISDLSIRRPDSESFYDDDEAPAARSSLPMLGLGVVLVAIVAVAAFYFDLIPADLGQRIGQGIEQLPAPVAPTGEVPNGSNPPAAAPPATKSASESEAASPDEATTVPAPTNEPPASTVNEDPTFGREFSDTSGSFRIRAEFVAFQPDRGNGSRVLLRKSDGSEIDVAMNRLSKEDQAWIRDEVKRRRQP